MKLADALKRIEQLEAKVRELEARPVQQIHHHYPPIAPMLPQPTISPWPTSPVTVCGDTDYQKGLVWRNPAPNAACAAVPTGVWFTIGGGSGN